jgi:hypothetical protein
MLTYSILQMARWVEPFLISHGGKNHFHNERLGDISQFLFKVIRQNAGEKGLDNVSIKPGLNVLMICTDEE